jgi:predicted transport protein
MIEKIDPQTQTMIDNIPVKTGKTLDEWHFILREAGLEKHGMIIKLLTDNYGISYGFANLIAILFRQQQAGGPKSDENLVDSQYEGSKAALRPIYESILAIVNSFGEDVVIAPKKAYVSLRRKKQFAIVQPTTLTRVDVGLNLKNAQASKRIEAGNIFNGMCSHLVKVQSAEEIDEELIDLLKTAYNQS